MSDAALGRKTTQTLLMRIKAATRRLYDACGGQESAAMVTRVNQQALSRYGSVNEGGAYIPVDVALDLMLDSGDVGLLKVMADAAGYHLVEKERSARADNVINLVAAFSKGSGALTHETLTDCADGRLDHAETERIKALVAELRKTLDTFDTAIDREAV